MKKIKTCVIGPSKGLQKLEQQIARQGKKNKCLSSVSVKNVVANKPVSAIKNMVQVKDEVKLIIMRDGTHMIGFVRCFANNDIPVPFNSILHSDSHAIYITYLHRIVHAVIPTKYDSTLTKLEFQKFSDATKDIVTLLPTDTIMSLQEPADIIENKFIELLMEVSLEEKFPDLYKLIDTDSSDQKATNKEAIAEKAEEFKRFMQSVTPKAQERLSEEMVVPLPLSGKKPVNVEQTPVKAPLREFGNVVHRLSHYFIEGAKRSGNGENSMMDVDD